MELLLFVVAVCAAAWLVVTVAEARRKVEPAKLAGELARALAGGDSRKAGQSLGKLPRWKVTQELKKVFRTTYDLRRSATTAAQAGVAPTAVRALHLALSRNEEVIVGVARKVAALADQSDGKLRRLPREVRELLDTDTRRLDEIRRASRTVQQRLQLATAYVQGGDADGQAGALEAFDLAIRELTSSSGR